MVERSIMTRKILRQKLDVEQLLRYADNNRELTTFGSDLRGAGYVIEKERALVITGTKGWLLIDAEDLPLLIEELGYINEELERRRRD